MSDLQMLGAVTRAPVWIPLAILGAILGVVVLLGIIAFVGALFEKITADGHAHLEPAEMPVPPAAVGQLTSAGLEVVKTGQERTSSLMKNYVWVLTSPDRRIVAGVDKSKIGTTSTFVSRRADGVWLVTKMALGTPSLRPRRALLDALQSDTQEATLALHRVRLVDESQDLLPFDPESAAAAAEQAKRAFYEDLVDAGLARWIDSAQTVAKLTLKGCIISALNVLSLPVTIARYAQRKPGVLARAAGLPPLRAILATAPGMQGIAPAALPEQFVMICSSKPGAQNDYMPYGVAERMYLPVFVDEVQAMAYSGLRPASPGETRELIRVSRQWLGSCIDLGYELVLHPHIAAARRTISAAELHSPAAAAAAQADTAG